MSVGYLPVRSPTELTARVDLLCGRLEASGPTATTPTDVRPERRPDDHASPFAAGGFTLGIRGAGEIRRP